MDGIEAQRLIDNELCYHEKRAQDLCVIHAQYMASNDDTLAAAVPTSLCKCDMLNTAQVWRPCQGRRDVQALETTGLPTTLIHDELSDNERRVLHLRTLRNTYAPVSKLPVEVLATIFEELKSLSHGINSVREWHYVAHVCVQWRFAALGAASLWSEPPTHIHNYTVAMLERSRSYPLKVVFSNRSKWETINALLGRDFSRIKSIEISEVSAYRAVINMPPTTQVTHIRIDLPTESLGAEIFTVMPEIKVMHLIGVDLQCAFPRSSTLTSLSLVDFDMRENISCKTFLRSLSDMPMLECLTISSPIMDDWPIITANESFGAYQSVLSRLRELSLRATASIVREILSNINLPGLQRAVIQCIKKVDGGPTNIGEYYPFIPLICRLYAQGDYGPIDNFTVKRSSFSFYSYDGRGEEFDPCIGFDATDYLDPAFYRELMKELKSLPGNPLLTIENLSLRLPNNATGGQTVESLGDLTKVRYITLHQCSKQAIECLAVASTGSDVPIPFPDLRQIAFRDKIAPHVAEKEVLHTLSKELQTCLTSRERRGLRMYAIITNWRIDPCDDDWLDLAKLVDHLVYAERDYMDEDE